VCGPIYCYKDQPNILTQESYGNQSVLNWFWQTKCKAGQNGDELSFIITLEKKWPTDIYNSILLSTIIRLDHLVHK